MIVQLGVAKLKLAKGNDDIYDTTTSLYWRSAVNNDIANGDNYSIGQSSGDCTDDRFRVNAE